MKKANKGILDNDMVISAENIQKMGEVIALTSIKTLMFRSGKDLRCLYNGLLHDMNRSKEDYSPFSNAYDIAQEAMLFLCQHMGKTLDDVYYTKTGRNITIKQACFSVADRYLAKTTLPLCSTQQALTSRLRPNHKQYSTKNKRTIIPPLTGLYPKCI